MAPLTVKERMIRSIARRKGEVVLRSDFTALGSASQISRALKELTTAGKIVRLGYGVYAKARPSRLNGQPSTRVSLEDLAREAFERLGVAVKLGRAAAAYVSGETNQVPAYIALNTGAKRISRKISIGISTIRYENDYGKRRCEDVGLRLADLLAESDYSQPRSAEEREWLDAPAAGGELL